MIARALTLAALEVTRHKRMRLFRQLHASQWWPRERLEQWKNQRLEALLRHTLQHVPYYQEFSASADIHSGSVTARDLARFPLVDKRIMTARLADFRSNAVSAERFLPNSTSGSTGTPFKFYADAQANQMRAANDLRIRMWAGWKIGERQALLWGHRGDVQEQERWLNRLRNEFNSRVLTLNAYDLDEATMSRFQEVLAKYRPTLMIGYASALSVFAQFLLRNSLAVGSLRGIISSAETLLPEYRQSIESAFSCPVLDHYGSREFGTISQQCSSSSHQHITIERVWVEIVDDKGATLGPGERGEILITDLDNYAMPFIRYRTGDLGTMGTASCECGRGLPVLKSVEGRVSEIIVGRNGKMFSTPGPWLFGGDVPGIRQMQVVQESLDNIIVRIVPNDAWTDTSASMLRQRIISLLGDVRVDIEIREAIPKSASGKYLFAVSKVSPFLHTGSHA